MKPLPYALFLCLFLPNITFSADCITSFDNTCLSEYNQQQIDAVYEHREIQILGEQQDAYIWQQQEILEEREHARLEAIQRYQEVEAIKEWRKQQDEEQHKRLLYRALNELGNRVENMRQERR